MATFYKRSIRRRFYSWIDDIKWKWDRHREGFLCGFSFGVLVAVIVFELVWSV